MRAGHDSERRVKGEVFIRRHHRPRRRHLHRLRLSSSFRPEHLQHHTQFLLFKNKKIKSWYFRHKLITSVGKLQPGSHTKPVWPFIPTLRT